MCTLSVNELLDVVLCLDRVTIDAMVLVTRKFRHASSLVPRGACLRELNYVQVYCSYPPTRRFRRLRKLARRLMHKDVRGEVQLQFRTKPSPCNVVGLYKRKGVDVLAEKLSNLLQTSTIQLLTLESASRCALPTNFMETLTRNRSTTGFIGRLRYVPELPNHIVERLPVASGQVLEVELRTFRPSSGVRHKTSEEFVRHAIGSGVLRLKACTKEDGFRQTVDPSDVTEETILDFCFGKRAEAFHDDGNRELWLENAVVSSAFLRKFVEACERSYHVVDIKVFLHGAVCAQVDFDDIAWLSHFPAPCDSFGDVPLRVRCYERHNLLMLQRGSSSHSVFDGKETFLTFDEDFEQAGALIAPEVQRHIDLLELEDQMRRAKAQGRMVTVMEGYVYIDYQLAGIL
ncbi:hypothetical protein AAVH_06757 [Aphelenchoides avenae]|nr:hypothetical protein AAVH_06757 [Aphelenchus avenae]